MEVGQFLGGHYKIQAIAFNLPLDMGMILIGTARRKTRLFLDLNAQINQSVNGSTVCGPFAGRVLGLYQLKLCPRSWPIILCFTLCWIILF